MILFVLRSSNVLSSSSSSSELSSTRKPALALGFAGGFETSGGGRGRFEGTAGEELGGYAIGEEGAAMATQSMIELGLDFLIDWYGKIKIEVEALHS